MTTHADEVPELDVVAILRRQHERIRELFAAVRAASGEERQHTFDELRALLAAHETGEEMVLRPFTAAEVDSDVADALNSEENSANHVLVELEKLDVDSTEFESTFLELQGAVLAHADHEEEREFPSVQERASSQQLERMGRALLAAEKLAPTHPHPSTAGSPAAQWAIGPFASLLDRAKDAVKAALS